eukprot:scaffold474_cov64-Phaeocystis_antarctica.AAC.1
MDNTASPTRPMCRATISKAQRYGANSTENITLQRTLWGLASGDTGRQDRSEDFCFISHPNDARLCSSADKNRQCERQLPRAQTARVPLTYFQLAQVCRNSEQLACRIWFLEAEQCDDEAEAEQCDDEGV